MTPSSLMVFIFRRIASTSEPMVTLGLPDLTMGAITQLVHLLLYSQGNIIRLQAYKFRGWIVNCSQPYYNASPER